MTTCPYSPFDLEVMADPYPFYTWLRSHAPVYEVPGAGYFTVSRYQDIMEVCKNPDIFSSRVSGFLRRDENGRVQVQDAGVSDPRSGVVLGIEDPPVHTQQRGSLSKCFAPRVRQIEPWLRSRCESHMARAMDQGGMDYMAEYASLVPAEAIAHLLGFPLEDARQLQHWSSLCAQTVGGVVTDEDLEKNVPAIMEFHQYLGEKLVEAKKSPGDNVMGDLARLLMEKNSGLTEDEIFGILFQVLVGANETTVAAVGSALLLSGEFPDVFAAVNKNQALIPNYLEEVLRRETPAQGNYRKTAVDTELAGVTLPAGSTLTLLWAAANRDENEFENPEQLIIDRPNIKNHLGFGQGIHFCVGAALARLETRVALEAFLAATGNATFSLAEEPVTYIPSLFIRRLARLNVRFS